MKHLVYYDTYNKSLLYDLTHLVPIPGKISANMWVGSCYLIMVSLEVTRIHTSIGAVIYSALVRHPSVRMVLLLMPPQVMIRLGLKITLITFQHFSLAMHTLDVTFQVLLICCGKGALVAHHLFALMHLHVLLEVGISVG